MMMRLDFPIRVQLGVCALHSATILEVDIRVIGFSIKRLGLLPHSTGLWSKLGVMILFLIAGDVKAVRR